MYYTLQELEAEKEQGEMDNANEDTTIVRKAMEAALVFSDVKL